MKRLGNKQLAENRALVVWLDKNVAKRWILVSPENYKKRIFIGKEENANQRAIAICAKEKESQHKEEKRLKREQIH